MRDCHLIRKIDILRYPQMKSPFAEKTWTACSLVSLRNDVITKPSKTQTKAQLRH